MMSIESQIAASKPQFCWSCIVDIQHFGYPNLIHTIKMIQAHSQTAPLRNHMFQRIVRTLTSSLAGVHPIQPQDVTARQKHVET